MKKEFSFTSMKDLLKEPIEVDECTWKFEKDKPTYLQTKSVRDGDVKLYLTKETDDNPQYHIVIENNFKAIANVLVHMSEKDWVDKAELLEVMLPILRSVAYGKEG